MRHTDPTLSIVVPTRNEARNLEIVLPELPPTAQILIVDGHSVDDTLAVARRLRPDATLLTQTRRGKGNALACGFAAATGDIIIMFDADGSADPTEIPAFVNALVAGADVAKGTRNATGPDSGSHDITALRSAGNRGLNTLANLMLGAHYSDLCYGYNAFWTDMLDVLHLPHPDLETPTTGDGMLWGDGFEIETLLTCRFAHARAHITEVPSVERPRIHGHTNLRTFTDGLRVLRTLLRETLHPHHTRRTGVDRTPTTHTEPTAATQPAATQPAAVALAPAWVHGDITDVTVPTAGRHTAAAS